MSKTLLALLAFCLGAALFLAAPARGIMQMDVPGQGKVFVWTTDEMDKLENVLSELLAQRDKLTKQLSTCRAGT